MDTETQYEWDSLTASTVKKSAAEIDKLSTLGLSAIQIASRVNLRVSVVWRYLQTRNPKVLKENQAPSVKL
jgi:hypothetical protein